MNNVERNFLKQKWVAGQDLQISQNKLKLSFNSLKSYCPFLIIFLKPVVNYFLQKLKLII